MVVLHCRAVNLTEAAGKADANTTFAFILQNELKNNPLFVSTNTSLRGELVQEGNTFTFQVTAALKEPLKL